MMTELDNRDAVIAIQGGGVYGLALLGQIEAVIEKHGYVPLALAGTSAGAIVATLVWAGLKPSDIRKEFVDMAQNDDGLLALLGPFEPPPKPCFAFGHFEDLCGRVTVAMRPLLNPEKGFVSSVKTLMAAFGVKRLLVPHIRRRGFFSGEQLERKINDLIRRAANVPTDVAPLGELVRFRHFREMEKKGREDAYRPPLLLTTTNLSKRKLEIVNSEDEKYMNVPIAKAVRASAGYPVFFRPREIPECPDGGWFVDGGMVSNFPIWVFSELFRKQLLGNRNHLTLASKPWIRIGLRVVDDAVTNIQDLNDPTAFWLSLFAMLTGQARNELEKELASRAPRTVQILQSVTDTHGPQRTLGIRELDADKISAMVTAGYNFADKKLQQLGTPSIYKQSANKEIETEIAFLVQRCETVMGLEKCRLKLRANVFIPVEERMKLVYHHNMDGDPDQDLEFSDQASGLTGLCYMTGRPHLCNLERIGQVRQARPDLELFGMPKELQHKVRADRTWLASVPIFDPYEFRYALGRGIGGAAQYPVKSAHGLETDFDGPLLGVLNVDAGWDYNDLGLAPDPEVHFQNERIQIILTLMQSTASRVAEVLTQNFPVEGD